MSEQRPPSAKCPEQTVNLSDGRQHWCQLDAGHSGDHLDNEYWWRVYRDPEGFRLGESSGQRMGQPSPQRERHGWIVRHNAIVVECPGCGFAMGIEHESEADENADVPGTPFYDCPSCGDARPSMTVVQPDVVATSSVDPMVAETSKAVLEDVKRARTSDVSCTFEGHDEVHCSGCCIERQNKDHLDIATNERARCARLAERTAATQLGLDWLRDAILDGTDLGKPCTANPKAAKGGSE